VLWCVEYITEFDLNTYIKQTEGRISNDFGKIVSKMSEDNEEATRLKEELVYLQERIDNHIGIKRYKKKNRNN